MVLHAFPSMFVSFYTPLREFSEHGVYKHENSADDIAAYVDSLKNLNTKRKEVI